MADFVEVMKIRNRMCESIKGCYICPLSSSNNKTSMDCKTFLHNYSKEAKKILLKWDREHPATTNADKFEEVFGFRFDNKICLAMDSGECNKHLTNCNGCPHDNFWNREYEKPKEKANDKLRIL